MHKSIFTLNDGRSLSYLKIGNRNATPYLFLHGSDDSKLTALLLEEKLETNHIRLIAVDRPGFGDSSFNRERTLSNYSNDVVQLLDELNLEKVQVIAISGGGPVALGLASELKDRIGKIIIFNGTAPYAKENFRGMFPPVRFIFFIMKRLPLLGKFILTQMTKNPSSLVKNMRRLKNNDYSALTDDLKLGDRFIASMNDGHKNGINGALHEWKLLVSEWGINLNDIEQRVVLSYGEKDVNVPITMGEYLHAQLPNSRLKINSCEGHLSNIINNLSDISLK